MEFVPGQNLTEILKRLSTHPPLEITAIGLDDQGLELLSVTSSEFSPHAVRNLPVPPYPDLVKLMPYTVILVNSSPKEISRHSVVWTFTDTDGKKTTHTVSYGNSASLRGGDSIPPSTSRLVSTLPRLGMSPGPSEPEISSHWESWQDFYQRQLSVTITLDSVVFSDGQIVGPDSSASALLTQMQARAQREIVDEILADDNGANLEAVRERLLRLRLQALPLLGSNAGHSEPGHGAFLSAVRRQKSAEELLILLRGMYASSLLERAGSLGMAAVVESAVRLKRSR